MSFTTQSLSVPVVDAKRVAKISPLMVRGSVRGSLTKVRTSVRSAKGRWSSTSHCLHVDSVLYMARIGRTRYGTGLAGSDTYSEYCTLLAAGGANASPPPGWR